MKITTILFDFVGVLMEINPFSVVSSQVEMIDRRIGQVVNDRQFRESVLNDFCITEIQFENVLEHVVDKYKPFDPLWQLLPDLRRRYCLGIINNGTRLTYPRFNEKYGIDQQFDVFVSSAVEGVRKPNPQIYKIACKKLHVLPGECIFLDDNIDNVCGAIRAGMQGMWWETHQMGLQQFMEYMASNDNFSSSKQ